MAELGELNYGYFRFLVAYYLGRKVYILNWYLTDYKLLNLIIYN